MLKRLSIRTQVLLLLSIGMILLALVLGSAEVIRRRQSLIDQERERSLILAGVIHSTIDQTAEEHPARLSEMEELNATLTGLVNDNKNVEFIAATWPDGQVIFHSNPTLQSRQINALRDPSTGKTSEGNISGFGSVLLTSVRYENPTQEGQRSYYITVGISPDAVNRGTRHTLWSTVAEGLGLLTISAVLIGISLHYTVNRSFRQLREGAQAFTAGKFEYRVEGAGSFEIQDLAETLNEMAAALQKSREETEQFSHEMETRIQERTRDLEISAEIGRIITSLRDLDHLMHETVEQIRRRFEVIYHAQIFLLDDQGEFAILVQSTGDAGRMLLQAGHKLRVGSDSVIGRVTSRGQTIIASDTRRGDAPWQPNPLLPDTRAEMALPLMIEGRVLGALDLQSTSPDVFTDEMVQVLGVLAAQIAVAIENARLLEESEKRIREINILNRQLTRAAWQEFMEPSAEAGHGYVYDRQKITPLQDVAPASNGIETDIQVRGQVIGKLSAALPTEQVSSDDRALVEAVAERVALAVENARLFQQTQSALADTQRLYETARAISSTPTLESIYQLITDQVGGIATIDGIEILLAGPDLLAPQHLESIHRWMRTTQPADFQQILPLNPLSQETLADSGPLLLSNVTNELSPAHPLYTRLGQLRAQSAVIAPLNAGNRWFGTLLCTSEHPNSFTSSYVTFISALADQLAIAIDNRRLFDEAQSEARRARALAEAGQLASQIGGDYETGLQNLFQAVAGPGHYDRWWFGLLSDTKINCITASSTAFPHRVDVENDQGALAEAARIGEIVLVNDPSDHPAVNPDSDFELWGKHIAIPVKIGSAVVGVLLIGRSLDEANLDERDLQLAATLVSQVAVATQNQRLYTEVESQRQNLQTILDTMPTGVLVMDTHGDILLSNQNLKGLLGPDMRPGTDHQPEPYQLVRTGTNEDYPRAEWPLSRVFQTGAPALVDDMTVRHPNGFEINVLSHAAPIYDEHGKVSAVVGAFQDITELHELERALQESLRETTLLYEASRSISRASTLDELLQVTLQQVNTIQPTQVYIFLNENTSDSPLTLAACQPEHAITDEELQALTSLMTQEPVTRNFPTVSPDLNAYLEKMDFTTIGGFPLRVRDQINGWIVVGFTASQTFTTEQRRLIVTLTDQIAITVENQRLFQRTEESLQNTAKLYRASRAITDAHSMPDILMAFVNHAAPASATYAALYLDLGEQLHAGYGSIEVAATWGESPAGDLTHIRYRADQFPFTEMLTSKDIVWFDDVEAPDVETIIRHTFQMFGLRAGAIIPLHISEQALGLILIGVPDVWKHTETEARLYQSLADQASVSLQNDRLFRQAQRRALQLSTSAEISRALTSILQLDELLPQVVNLIRDAFEYDHVQVFMVSEDRSIARLVASTGDAGRKLLEMRHSLPVGSRSVIGQVTMTGEPQIALDTADARVIHMPNPLLPKTRSEMALPLITRGQIVGALDVQSNLSGAFTDDDIQALASLAELVATAIDNARLFEISEQHAREMEFLFSAMTAASGSPNMEESLRNTAEILRGAMDVSDASIFLPDESGLYLVKTASLSEAQTPKAEVESVPMDESILGWAARYNEAILIGDAAKDPRPLPIGSTTCAVMIVPMRSSGNLTGVLLVESAIPNAFDSNDMKLLQTLSGSLGAIIQSSRLLREVQQANERLLEVDRLKTNFLAAMSHELRTPLNSIIGFSRVILKGIDGPLTETQEQDLTTIYESGKHLLGLVNDILDQAKIEAGKMELSFAYFKLQDVVKGVMSTAVGLTRDKPIRLFTEIEENLPDAYGDEFRTRQILLNLVSNASKFTKEGSVTTSAYITVEDGRQFIQVSVTDTGIGIADKDMGLLFVPFQQIDNSTTRSVEGTGMGLPLAKSLTELQGGRIWVDSEPGVGSTFHVIVPIAPLPAEETVEEPPATIDLSGEIENLLSQSQDFVPESPIILVVEDDEEVINLYRRYLSREGYEVLGTTRPEETEELVLNYHPRVVLLDVNMPTRDGWDVLAHLKDSPSTFHTPVIVCSINPDTERGFHMGAAAYLIKPFTEDELVETIRRIEQEAGHQYILLVDDKPETIRAFRDALETSPRYSVLEATSGQQALDIVQYFNQIDLVILDLRMPGIDGFAVLQSLRSNEKTANIPVLILTAEDINEDERATLESAEVHRKDALDEQELLQRVEARLKDTRKN